ncbi:MAG: retroviral-like aspartic protease family protein [Pseudobdellovibrionaceae bacterium]|nr:retroviral-like aspartic protease family protein [Pseudobdellovibrionaceae bacterium]
MKALIFMIVFFTMNACVSRHEQGKALAEVLKDEGYLNYQLKKNAANHFEIEGKINGKDAVFIIDTGASRTVLDLQRSKSFGLISGQGSKPAGGLGSSQQESFEGTIANFMLGNINRKDFKVALIDLSHVNASLQRAGIPPKDGVIGADILLSGEAIIDYARATLYLRSK